MSVVGISVMGVLSLCRYRFTWTVLALVAQRKDAREKKNKRILDFTLSTDIYYLYLCIYICVNSYRRY